MDITHDDGVNDSASTPPGPVAPVPSVEPVRVVAIGASAGGLEALQQLFAALPGHTGMAFVVVQHLSPDFKSLMPDLLGRHTRMPVVGVDRNLTLLADTVYVLTAGVQIEWQGDQLITFARAHDDSQHLPIDRMFTSLAPLQDRAAAIVLSGTGQDGMAGAKVVKQAGGLVIAQQPHSARFDSMPRAVIDAGLADIVAMPAEIGHVLLQWLRDPAEGRKFTPEAPDEDSLLASPYAPVLQVLQRACDIDFSLYKSGTIMRRIDRWLTAGESAVSPGTLATHLQDHPAEIDRLLGDLLIGVTHFFRDPEAFDALRLNIEQMIATLGDRDQLRIWCCGCSTGEEAYSLAILGAEAFQARGQPPRLRILATDAHPASVQKASSGIYAEEALVTLPAALRDKYFRLQSTGHYKVIDTLRRHVVFSVQNVLRDAGFQRIDIVTCRNLLIYLRPAAQAQALASFHLALVSGGLLMLGKSEMPNEHADAFMTVDEQAHLFKKRPGLSLPMQARPLFGLPARPRPATGTPLDNRASYRLQEVLAQRYVPAGLLVNQNDELVYVYGDAGRYLQAAPGRFGGTLFNLLTGPLRTAVTMSLRRSAQNMEAVSVNDVLFGDEPNSERLRIDVSPIVERTLPHHYFMVHISPMAAAPEVAIGGTPLTPDHAVARHIHELETELIQTREALQRSVEDLESVNEELQAGNEELQSSNEELQSSNEELHTLNEELYSVNSEHELKIQELRDTSADLNNLIRATELPIVFLDLEARLRLYTPPATSLFPLRPDDIGRELRDLLPRENDLELFDDISSTLVGSVTPDRELNLRDGRIMRRRLTPYRTDLGVITGLVITYVDVTQQVQMRAQQMELQHQTRLSAIMDSVPHLMWTCVTGGDCDFLNPQWERYTGLPAAQQLGYSWLEQIHPDDREGLMELWNNSVSTGMPLRTQFRIRRHDGEWRWFDTQAVPQRDASGRIIKWFGSNTDVHDVILLQGQLIRREQFTQMVADNINGMVGYWDRDQRNQFANRHYLEWFGITASEMQGKHLREVLGDQVYELNRSHIEAALRGETQHFERTLTRPDGSQGHLLAEYQPHVINGVVQGFIATATDITAVQEARRLADQVFEVSPVAKLIVSRLGRIVRWNPAAQQLLGYDQERMNGLAIEQLIVPQYRQRHEPMLRGFMQNTARRPMSSGRILPLLRADGRQVEVEIDLSGVHLDGYTAAIVCIREVEMSPHALKRLDVAVQARNAFLAQMSHEIRTPLNAILGMAQLLEMDHPTPRQQDRLHRIEEASNLLLNIISDVLDYSKIEAGRLQIRRDEFALAPLIARSISIVRQKADLKRLKLHVNVAQDLPPRLIGDEHRIEQILVNLLGNAVKFTNEGSITIRAKAPPVAEGRLLLHIEVQDTGIGIATEDQAELFTPFRQVHQGPARRYGGTGLGLSISRQLARAMGGDCQVASMPGQGSTFWFTVQVNLPALTGATAAPDVTSARAASLRHLDRQVLIVEDNPVNLLVLHEMLTAALGVTVTDASDGFKALEVAATSSFDLVLMDLQMPGLDGLETTRQLRQRPGWAETPIYAVSANVQPADVSACLAAGMNGHLGKPVMATELIALADRLWPPAA